ncbi:TMEM175 family protein [Protaetiibacter intestinalis]|uniref:DUF1211 domain-containing protein n=1 Tax=Protaetiibacter intestinalis TaxID=2419774 RepID=A0A387BFH5_9MICO|nr:TMEM175 family protein [Protaetiibacter intestinalis]AYF97250.1 DUF1211 domain-containing protein [Protaetiibacter intestinalis]
MTGVRQRLALLSRGEGTERIAFFSDAVFAIALTLLVLDIRLPEGLEPDELWPALGELWPQFFAYALTFAVLGINWITHHRKFRLMERFDTGLIWINLAFLAFVALAPFPTSVLSEYPEAPAVVLYAVQVSMLSILQGVLWWYAFRRGLLSEAVDVSIARFVTISVAVTPAIFLATIPVALLVDPTIAMLCWLLLPPAGALTSRLAARRLDRVTPATPATPSAG